MKTIIKKHLFSLCVVISMLTLCACTDTPAQPTSAPTVTVAPEETVTAAPSQAPTSEPTQTPTPTPPEVTHGAVKISKDAFIDNAEYLSDGIVGTANDGTYNYIIENNRLYKVSLTDENDKTEIYVDFQIIPTYISGYYENRNHEGCLSISGRCADGNYYNIGYNLTTNSVDILLSDNSSFSLVSYNKTPVLYGYHQLFCSNVLYPNDNPIAFVFSSKKMINLIPAGNYVLIVENINDEIDNEKYMLDYMYVGPVTFSIGLFDLSEEKLIAKTDLHFDSYTSLSYLPKLDNDTIYLGFSDFEGLNEEYFSWEFRNDPSKDGDFDYIFVETDLDQFPVYNIYGDLDIEALRPGPCPLKFADLRKTADELQAKYDVNIYISDECRGIVGGYLCYADNIREDIDLALKTMDYELAKYPDGFFSQFKGDSSQFNGIDLFLAGELKGDGDNTLDYAGGFRTTIDDKIVIYVDIASGNYTSTFHHELSHAIESLLGEMNVDETYWSSLNPQHKDGSSAYIFSYVEETNSDYYKHILYWDDNIKDDAFIDSYSLTYPTEDRARIFEHIMMDDSWVNFKDFPMLIKKLNHYADVIRAGFDTTNWPEKTLWEKYN